MHAETILVAQLRDFRAEVISVRRAQMIVNASVHPMDIGAFEFKGKGLNGKGKGNKGVNSDVGVLQWPTKGSHEEMLLEQALVVGMSPAWADVQLNRKGGQRRGVGRELV